MDIHEYIEDYMSHEPEEPRQVAMIRAQRVCSVPSGNVAPRINGKPFLCDCGCNVFRWWTPEMLRCNHCRAFYDVKLTANEPIDPDGPWAPGWDARKG